MPRVKHTRIVSSTPRRTRLRLSVKRRNEAEMRRIVQALEADGDIRDIRTNIRTGSILIRHAPGAMENIQAALRDLGVVLASITGADVAETEAKSGKAAGLSAAVADLNRRLGLADSGLFSLRTIVPLGLGALALAQFMRRGLQVEAAPWYFLAYLSLDSFARLNFPGKAANPEESAALNANRNFAPSA